MDPISVLIVDDNPLFRRFATEYFLDFEDISLVGAADGGKSAISKTRDLKPQVILLDLLMPGMNGWDTIPHLRKELPEVGIIILTHRPLLDVYRQTAMEAGADEIVSKISMDTDLLPVIRRVAARRQNANDRCFENAPWETVQLLQRRERRAH